MPTAGWHVAQGFSYWKAFCSPTIHVAMPPPDAAELANVMPHNFGWTRDKPAAICGAKLDKRCLYLLSRFARQKTGVLAVYIYSYRVDVLGIARVRDEEPH